MWGSPAPFFQKPIEEATGERRKPTPEGHWQDGQQGPAASSTVEVKTGRGVSACERVPLLKGRNDSGNGAAVVVPRRFAAGNAASLPAQRLTSLQFRAQARIHVVPRAGKRRGESRPQN